MELIDITRLRKILNLTSGNEADILRIAKQILLDMELLIENSNGSVDINLLKHKQDIIKQNICEDSSKTIELGNVYFDNNVLNKKDLKNLSANQNMTFCDFLLNQYECIDIRYQSLDRKIQLLSMAKAFCEASPGNLIYESVYRSIKHNLEIQLTDEIKRLEKLKNNNNSRIEEYKRLINNLK